MGGSSSKAPSTPNKIREISGPSFEVEEDAFDNPLSAGGGSAVHEAQDEAIRDAEKYDAKKRAITASLGPVTKSIGSLKASTGLHPEWIANAQSLTLGTNFHNERHLRSLPEILRSFKEDAALPKNDR